MQNLLILSVFLLCIISVKINCTKSNLFKFNLKVSQGANVTENSLQRRIRQTNAAECVLPTIPNANIEIVKQKSTKKINILSLNVTCEDNYILQSKNVLLNCFNGIWDEDDIPQCKSCVKRTYSTIIEDTDPRLFCAENAFFTECGQRNYGRHQPFIVNGRKATFAEFPWHVALYKKDPSDSQPMYQCGGSIITERNVLTVAHCLSNENGKIVTSREYYVAAGKFHSKYNSDRETTQNRKVVRIDLHPSYKGAIRDYAWDIAVTLVDQPFEISSIVHPVCVDWKTKSENEHFISGKYGEVAGWGKKEEDSNGAAAELRVLKVPYIEREQCNRLVPTTFVKFVTFDKFCAGYMNGSSVCGGDSGGGLVFEKEEKGLPKYYIRGLVSVGPAKDGTCDSYGFTSYTKVSKYIMFIRDSIENLNVTTLDSPGSTTTDLSYDNAAETTVPCTTPNEEEAECISLYDCKIFVSALKYYQGIPGITEFINESQCGQLDEKKVCCGSEFTYPSITYSNPVPTEAIERRNLHLLPRPGVCGRRSLPDYHPFEEVNERNVAELLDYPWMARVELYYTSNTFLLDPHIACEGFLINERYVISSGLCARQKHAQALFRVHLGEYDTTTEVDCLNLDKDTGPLPNGRKCADPVLVVNVEEIIIHPLFNETLRVNNIALLRLASTVPYTDFIKPICLPLNGERSLPGRQLFISGWSTRLEEKVQRLKKQKAIYYALPIEECKKQKYYESSMIDDDVCVVNGITRYDQENKAGGPLMATLTDSCEYYAEGIMVYRNKWFTSVFTPSAVTKIATHMNWILDTINP